MQRKRGIRRPRRQSRHDRPSTYIQPIKAIQPTTPVVLRCRVSRRLQNATGNNTDQEAGLRAAVQARGGTVVATLAHVGRATEAEATLCEAANLAAQAGAVLFAESTSRLIRHPHYNPKCRPHLTPTAHALRGLHLLCAGVTLVTLLDPDATGTDERSHQSRRGQRCKGRPGGHPKKRTPGYKKEFRQQSVPKVRWMTWVGMSNRAIARALGTPEQNVRRWGAPFLRCVRPGKSGPPHET